MNVAYWFLLAPIAALDGYVPISKVQKWAPYVYRNRLLCQVGVLLTGYQMDGDFSNMAGRVQDFRRDEQRFVLLVLAIGQHADDLRHTHS